MERAEKVNQALFGKSVKRQFVSPRFTRVNSGTGPSLASSDQGQVIFISYFFSPRIIDDRCILADSGSAIQLGPSMIRMLGPL